MAVKKWVSTCLLKHKAKVLLSSVQTWKIVLLNCNCKTVHVKASWLNCYLVILFLNYVCVIVRVKYIQLFMLVNIYNSSLLDQCSIINICNYNCFCFFLSFLVESLGNLHLLVQVCKKKLLGLWVAPVRRKKKIYAFSCSAHSLALIKQ